MGEGLRRKRRWASGQSAQRPQTQNSNRETIRLTYGPGEGERTMSGYWLNFDLTNGINILRLICGLFFIPHIIGKFTEPATLNFFKAAKFNPPATWMYVAGTIETFLTIGLVFAIYTPYVAAVAALHLLVAGAATYKVTKKWIWVIGGIEYCVFWMLACIALAVLTWPK
jgi:putative oxidoreductase